MPKFYKEVRKCKMCKKRFTPEARNSDSIYKSKYYCPACCDKYFD